MDGIEVWGGGRPDMALIWTGPGRENSWAVGHGDTVPALRTGFPGGSVAREGMW